MKTDVEIKLNEIKALLNEGFQVKKTYSPLQKYELKERMKAPHYMVYSFKALPTLIERLKTLDQFDNLHRQARYVVNELGEIWFAFQGVPGWDVEYLPEVDVDVALRRTERIPAHSDMLLEGTAAIASGVVVFSAGDYCIEALTNWSGHIRPHRNSLVWPLAILHHLGANFSPKFKFAFFSKEGIVEKHEQVSILASQIPELLSEIAFVPPPSSYEIRVRSEKTWESFGPEQTPHFKIPPHSAGKRSRAEFFGNGLFDDVDADVDFDFDVDVDVPQAPHVVRPLSPAVANNFFAPVQAEPAPRALEERDFHTPTQG